MKAQAGAVPMHEKNGRSEANPLRADLLKGHAEGRFLEAVYRCSVANRRARHDLALELAALHNERLVDVVDAFEELKTKSLGSDFFLTRHVFEQALPNMKAEVSSVMRCVIRLYRDAGPDLAAGTILDGFIQFCAKDNARPQEALEMIEGKPDEFADLLTAVLVAGSRIDTSQYLGEAIRLCRDRSIELRRRAAFSLGRIEWPEGEAVTDPAFQALEQLVELEVDDNLVAVAIKSAFALCRKEKSQEKRAVVLIAMALSKGDEHSIHAASEVFGFSTAEVWQELLDVLLSALVCVKPGNKGTLDNIDYGINYLLESQEQRGIEFLEQLLLAHSGAVTLPIFDSVTHTIATNPNLLGRLATRWFLKGERVLCEGIFQVTREMHESKVLLSIDPSELVPKDDVHIIFVARKAVGYLLTAPLMAASIIVSLMRETTDAQTLVALKALLLDPILLNFPGISDRYLSHEAKKGGGPAEMAIEDAIKTLNTYFQMLEDVGSIPELHPSEEQREAHMRYFGREVAESFKEAQKKSVFLSIISKSVLLYGRKSIDRVYGPDGESRRMETPLTSRSTTIEYPRMDSIDPVGLDYLTRICRVERFKE